MFLCCNTKLKQNTGKFVKKVSYENEYRLQDVFRIQCSIRKPLNTLFYLLFMFTAVTISTCLYLDIIYKSEHIKEAASLLISSPLR